MRCAVSAIAMMRCCASVCADSGSGAPASAWGVAAGSFAFGWGLNIVGHQFFEKNAPAFKDDPLSFIAGPVWDLQQLAGLGKKKKTPQATDADLHTNGVAVNGVPAEA